MKSMAGQWRVQGGGGGGGGRVFVLLVSINYENSRGLGPYPTPH